MTCIIRTRWLLLFFEGILAIASLVGSALPSEVILSVHENFTVENCTVRIEDIDAQAAKVWLLLERGHEPARSMVLGINDSVACVTCALMVTGIYSGENADLVCLMLNDTNTTNTTNATDTAMTDAAAIKAGP